MSTPTTRAPCRKWTICSVPGGRFAVAVLRCLGLVCTVGATFLAIKPGRSLPAVRAAAFLLFHSAEMKACVHGACATGDLEQRVTGCHCRSGCSALLCLQTGDAFVSYLYFYSCRNVRGVRVRKSASCVSGRCVREPVTDRRGSILQLVFTDGMTWRTERRSGLHTKLRRRRPASTPLVVPLSRDGAGVCFAVQQLCQCATYSRSDWLELIAGAGLNLIADAHAHRSPPGCLRVVGL